MWGCEATCGIIARSSTKTTRRRLHQGLRLLARCRGHARVPARVKDCREISPTLHTRPAKAGGPDFSQMEPTDELDGQRSGVSKCRPVRIQRRGPISPFCFARETSSGSLQVPGHFRDQACSSIVVFGQSPAARGDGVGLARHARRPRARTSVADASRSRGRGCRPSVPQAHQHIVVRPLLFAIFISLALVIT